MGEKGHDSTRADTGGQSLGNTHVQCLEGMAQALAGGCPLTFARAAWAGEEGWSTDPSPWSGRSKFSRTGRQPRGTGSLSLPPSMKMEVGGATVAMTTMRAGWANEPSAGVGPSAPSCPVHRPVLSPLAPGPPHPVSFLFFLFSGFSSPCLCLSRITRTPWGELKCLMNQQKGPGGRAPPSCPHPTCQLMVLSAQQQRRGYCRHHSHPETRSSPASYSPVVKVDKRHVGFSVLLEIFSK